MHTPLIGLFNRARQRYVRCASDDTAYLGFATESQARAYNSSNGNVQGIEYCEIDLSREVGYVAPPRSQESRLADGAASDADGDTGETGTQRGNEAARAVEARDARQSGQVPSRPLEPTRPGDPKDSPATHPAEPKRDAFGKVDPTRRT